MLPEDGDRDDTEIVNNSAGALGPDPSVYENPPMESLDGVIEGVTDTDTVPETDRFAEAPPPTTVTFAAATDPASIPAFILTRKFPVAEVFKYVNVMEFPKVMLSFDTSKALGAVMVTVPLMLRLVPLKVNCWLVDGPEPC